MSVDYRALSADALRGLIEEFVSREGTDYGEKERSFEDKVRDVERQLESGEARIVYDLVEESANIVPRRKP
ncbi:MAG TPA: YheU family protein [Vicinamibacteria bacterium]